MLLVVTVSDSTLVEPDLALQDGTMKISRYGHACIRVDVAGQRILIDPGVFSSPDAFSQSDLDVIVVTHQHLDHADLDRIPALLERNPDALLLAESAIAERLNELGRKWTPTAPGQKHQLIDITITGIGGHHAVILPELERVGNVGILIGAPSEPTIFHPGDSYGYSPDGVDVLALPLSAPWAKSSETIAFCKAVAPRMVFPIHDATLSKAGHGLYWDHVVKFGGIEDARLVPTGGTTEVDQ